MKKIVGLAAVAALVLAACTSTPTATETGVPTPDGGVVSAQMYPEDVFGSLADPDPCTVRQDLNGKKAGDRLSTLWPIPDNWAAPVGGTAYRVAYVSMLANEDDLVPVCGTVVIPKIGTTPAKVVNWAHGTVGLVQRCVPFRKFDKQSGIGGLNQALQSGGLGDDNTGFNALKTMLGQGYVVLATDYYAKTPMGGTFPYQPYAAGIAEGAQVLDLMRAAGPAGPVDYVTWGHSQGGGSSLWAGQIAGKYLADDRFTLKGVLGAAPATQFVATPTQPKEWIGKHLGDRDAYNFIENLVPIGDVLFSYVMVPWSELAKTPTSSKWSSIPPVGLNLPAVLTDEGKSAAVKVADNLCLDDVLSADTVTAASALLPFLPKPLYKGQSFFSEPFQGTNNGYSQGSESHIDKSCLGLFPVTKFQAQKVANWCLALAWNMPGPNGTNPNVDKMPADSVPMFIASGTSDNVVWCMSKANPPSPVDCLAAQYVESTGRTDANLTVKYYATNVNAKGKTVATDHFGVMPASAQDSVAFITKVFGG